MRKVLILQPRLDCSFKKGHVPTVEGPPNHPLRKHYLPFYDNLHKRHLNLDDSVYYEKKALWQFDPKDYIDSDYDIVYVPHKQKYQFDLGDKGRYYMQQVVPSIFSIDENGWGADLKNKIYPTKDDGAYDMLRKRIESNESKFAQPAYDPDFREKGYVLFVCQLPHDETIRYQSKVSVLEALEITLSDAALVGSKVIVKGHPANPGAMKELKELTLKYSETATWVENISIHQLLQNCSFVALVNSGVGIEAMFHGKLVLRYGDADYNEGLTTFYTGEEENYFVYSESAKKYDTPSDHLRAFIQSWYDTYYDVENSESFSKIV